MRWKVKPLQDFLRKRGLTITHKKAELAALCFSACKMNIPLKPTKAEEKSVKDANYNALLTIDGHKLLDLLSEIKTGWIGEEKGMEMWPPTMLLEIQGIQMSKVTILILNLNFFSMHQDYCKQKSYYFIHLIL